MRSWLKQERAQVQWSAIYLLVVVVAAAILLFTVIKPSFRKAQERVTSTKAPTLK